MMGVIPINRCGRSLLVHLSLTPYVAGLPAVEDLLSFKRDLQTFAPDHHCFAVRGIFLDCTNALQRSLSNIKQILKTFRYRCIKICRYRLLLDSINAFIVASVTYIFSLLNLDSFLGLFSIFRVKFMHAFSLGINKLLEE